MPYVSLFLFSCAVLMWTMAQHQVEAPWTRWPAQDQASSCRPTLSTASVESPFSTALTVTMTSHLSPCPETPPLPVTCKLHKHMIFPSNYDTFKMHPNEMHTSVCRSLCLTFLLWWICVSCIFSGLVWGEVCMSTRMIVFFHVFSVIPNGTVSTSIYFFFKVVPLCNFEMNFQQI